MSGRGVTDAVCTWGTSSTLLKALLQLRINAFKGGTLSPKKIIVQSADFSPAGRKVRFFEGICLKRILIFAWQA
jgi:hypothetical protein